MNDKELIQSKKMCWNCVHDLDIDQCTCNTKTRNIDGAIQRAIQKLEMQNMRKKKTFKIFSSNGRVRSISEDLLRLQLIGEKRRESLS